MNMYRKFLRIWIAIVSLGGFVTGWGLIARASETELTATGVDTSVALPEFAAIPTVESVNGVSTTSSSNVQAFTVNQAAQQQFASRLRTGGS